jgi:protocatechuate 3,4-dioxygenase beta subunit
MMKRTLLLLVPAILAIVAVAVAKAPASSWVASLSPPDEPGTRLIVSGRVFDETGKHGVAGVKLHAYHTDAKGGYGSVIPGQSRLKGTVVTNAEGRFEWRTIRPMPYPGGGNPAHIHIKASGGGYPNQWVDELWFSDDPYLTARQKEDAKAKGQFNPIVTTTRDASGVLRATFNIRLSKNPREH